MFMILFQPPEYLNYRYIPLSQAWETNHFKTSATLDSLVGQGHVLNIVAKCKKIWEMEEKTTLPSRKMYSVFYLVLNQRIKPLYKPLKLWPILFQKLKYKCHQWFLYIWEWGRDLLISKFHCWIFKMDTPLNRITTNILSFVFLYALSECWLTGF